MSLALALKTALALNEYETEQQQKKELKALLKEKMWNPEVLVLGGVCWWNRKVVKQVVDKKTGIVKDKAVVQKVKITVLTQDQDPTEVGNKGKFSFRNACGNRIYIGVKSYKEADEFVAEMYGKGTYRVSSVVN